MPIPLHRLMQLLLSPAADPAAPPKPPAWDGIVFRCWGVIFSWFGGILFAIPVCWAYGLVLLRTHPNALPDFYGVPTLAQLPPEVAWRAAIFVGGTGGCVLGGLYGIYLMIAAWPRLSPRRIVELLVVLETASVWIMVTGDNWRMALPCALVLPVAVFAGHRLTWWLRCRCA